MHYSVALLISNPCYIVSASTSNVGGGGGGGMLPRSNGLVHCALTDHCI